MEDKQEAKETDGSGLATKGLLATGVYLLAWGAYAFIGWGDFSEMEPNEWGDTFAGFSAGLAFFWLVLGFYQQGKELRAQVEELRHTVEASRDQAAALNANKDLMRTDLMHRVFEAGIERLSSISADIVFLMYVNHTAVQERNNRKSVVANWWSSFSSGDREKLFKETLDQVDWDDVYAGNPHSNILYAEGRPAFEARSRLFVETYNQLIKDLRSMDADSALIGFLERGYARQLVDKLEHMEMLRGAAITQKP